MIFFHIKNWGGGPGGGAGSGAGLGGGVDGWTDEQAQSNLPLLDWEGGGEVSWGRAGVSEFFYYEFKFKIKKNAGGWGGGGG